MNKNILLLLLPLVFISSVASMSEVATQVALNKQLLTAAESGAADQIPELLRRGANANARDDEGRSALYVAALYRKIECVRALIASPADINVRGKNGYTPLHVACATGDIDSVNALIRAKATVNARNELGATPLYIAAENGHSDCVKALIAAKADVSSGDNFGETALHRAAYNGKIDCLKILIAAKADVHVGSKHGCITPLHNASSYGNTDCAKALIEAGANVEARSLHDRRTPLNNAAEYYDSSCLNLLIEKKADVNAADRYGHTPLLWAAIRGHLSSVKSLLEANADLTAMNIQGKTAFHDVFQHGYTDCLEELVKYSYLLVPSQDIVSLSRKRIFNVLLQFVWLRKQHPQLDTLKSESLHHEIFSRNTLLQEDLAIILLDELKKGKELTSVVLIRSKDAAVGYLLKKLKEIFSKIPYHSLNPAVMTPTLRDLLDPLKVEENFGLRVREGLNERIKKLKTNSQ